MRKLKNTKEVIAELVFQYEPLQKYKLCEELEPYFGKKGLIQGISLGKNILYIKATNHIARNELNHNDTKNSLKKIVKTFKDLKGLDDSWDIKDIKIYYDPKPLKHLKTKIDDTFKQDFFEPSLGKFKNDLDDPLLYELLEAVRKQILKNREQEI